MTDADKQMLSEKIATLAEMAGIDGELLWEMAKECPQGHKLSRIISKGTHTDLCWDCVVGSSVKAAELTANILNPIWHPEWRISHQARDMTDPAVLVSLVKEWIRQQPEEEGWTYQVAWCDGQAVGNLYEVVDQDWGRHYDGADSDSEWTSLAQAFVKALEVEKGGPL